MKLETKNVQQVKEVEYGVYLWRLPDGRLVSDGEGHFLMIASTERDLGRMQALANAARDCGIEEGMPIFMSGHRVVTDEEYEEQKTRLALGLTPDPLDVPTIIAERKGDRDNNRSGR